MSDYKNKHRTQDSAYVTQSPKKIHNKEIVDLDRKDERQAVRDLIARDTEDFLKKGGKIKKCKIGETSDFGKTTLTERQKEVRT